MYDLVEYNEQLKEQKKKMPDSKPVFTPPSTADMGGYAKDKENNPFLHFFHNVGKDVENVAEWTAKLVGATDTAEALAAGKAVFEAAVTLVHTATSVYATRGADIEHDADAWTQLENLIKAVEHYASVVESGPATPAVPSQDSVPETPPTTTTPAPIGEAPNEQA